MLWWYLYQTNRVIEGYFFLESVEGQCASSRRLESGLSDLFVVRFIYTIHARAKVVPNKILDLKVQYANIYIYRQ